MSFTMTESPRHKIKFKVDSEDSKNTILNVSLKILHNSVSTVTWYSPVFVTIYSFWVEPSCQVIDFDSSKGMFSLIVSGLHSDMSSGKLMDVFSYTLFSVIAGRKVLASHGLAVRFSKPSTSLFVVKFGPKVLF